MEILCTIVVAMMAACVVYITLQLRDMQRDSRQRDEEERRKREHERLLTELRCIDERPLLKRLPRGKNAAENAVREYLCALLWNMSDPATVERLRCALVREYRRNAESVKAVIEKIREKLAPDYEKSMTAASSDAERMKIRYQASLAAESTRLLEKALRL